MHMFSFHGHSTLLSIFSRFWAAAPEGLMTYGSTQGNFSNLMSVSPPPPKLLIRPLRPQSRPLRPQIRPLRLKSGLSNPKSDLSDLKSGLSDPKPGLSDPKSGSHI